MYNNICHLDLPSNRKKTDILCYFHDHSTVREPGWSHNIICHYRCISGDLLFFSNKHLLKKHQAWLFILCQTFVFLLLIRSLNWWTKVSQTGLKSQAFPTSSAASILSISFLIQSQRSEERDDDILKHRQTNGNIYLHKQQGDSAIQLHHDHVTAEQTPKHKFHQHISWTYFHMGSWWILGHSYVEPFCTLYNLL